LLAFFVWFQFNLTVAEYACLVRAATVDAVVAAEVAVTAKARKTRAVMPRQVLMRVAQWRRKETGVGGSL
jgi:hypothetical protein